MLMRHAGHVRRPCDFGFRQRKQTCSETSEHSMAQSVVLKHEESGHLKTAYIGWSWTTLFFGFLVPLFRLDFKWAILMVILHFLAGAITSGFGILLTWLVFPLFYNKWYSRALLRRGYVPFDEDSAAILTRRGLPVDYVEGDTGPLE